MNSNLPETQTSSRRGGLIAGIILVGIGLSLLASRFITLPGLVPLFLGLGFLTGGCITHKAGLIIPGGILTGVGLGIFAVDGTFIPLSEPASGGLFLLIFSGGWYLITLLSSLFTPRAIWWPLIPGLALTVTGGLVLLGEPGLQALKILGDYWPVGLIVAGLLVMAGVFKKNC